MQSLLISILFSIVFISCHTKAEEAEPDIPPVPEALQDEKSRSTEFSYSKRGSLNLIEELYEELEENNTALEQLANDMELLKDKKDDSIARFEKYDSKSSRYYADVKSYINQIQDTILKNRVHQLIEESRRQYQQLTAAHKQAITTLETKELRLRDFYTVLKITRTAALIGNYQRQAITPLQSLSLVAREHDQLINRTDKLSHE